MQNDYELCLRKPVIAVSDQVGHKPACAVTEEGLELEIQDLTRGEIVLTICEAINSYCTADLHHFIQIVFVLISAHAQISAHPGRF